MVNLDGTLSKPEKLTIGVPQGSILGPLLFIIFLNDLCALKLFCTLNIYADDITLFCYGVEICIIRDRMKSDIELINKWLAHNQLILNWDKTKAMFFPLSCKDKTSPHVQPTNIYLHIDNHNIEFVDEFKILGVKIDNKFTFDSHIGNIVSKVSSKTNILLRNIKSFPYCFRISLFKLFIVPNFDYCSSVFIHLVNKTRNNRIKKSFNRSMKRLLNVEIDLLTENEQLAKLKEFDILPPFY